MYNATTFSSQNLSLIGNIESKQRQLWRLTGLINGNHSFFQNNLHLIYEIWVQSNAEYFQDIRYQIDFKADNKIYKNLFFRMKLFYFYETVLQEYFKKGDLRLNLGPTFKN